jgi:hypothetical protein
VEKEIEAIPENERTPTAVAEIMEQKRRVVKESGKVAKSKNMTLIKEMAIYFEREGFY